MTRPAPQTKPQTKKLTHAARVLRIREMLDSQAAVSVAELMQTFGVSRRTVYNDLRALEDAGVPIYADPARDGGWTINYTAKRQTLTLTVAQILSLGVARHALSFLEGTDLRGELESVIARLSRGLSPRYREFLGQLERKITIVQRGPKRYADRAEILDELLSCLLYDERVALSYRPPGQGVRKHEVEPLSLLVYSESLYLIGRSLTRQAHRIFAVDRITRASRLRGARFEYPADFDPRAFFEGAFGITLQAGEPEEVELLLDADQAPYVQERGWHPSQRFEPAADGRTRMRLRVRPTIELLQWVLGHIRGAEVVRPAGLRDAVREALAAALARHA